MEVGDIKKLPKLKGNGYFIVRVVGLNTYEGVQYAEVIPVNFNGSIREVNAERLLDIEPCEDSVSRKELINKIEILENMYGSDFYWEVRKIVDRLPPVIPKGVTVTDFADKCRECGKRLKNE